MFVCGHSQESKKTTNITEENTCNSHKDLLCRIYKELLELHNKKINDPSYKISKGYEDSSQNSH